MIGRNTHFSIAVHVLTVLAIYARENCGPTPSAKLAKSVDTNPAFLRQVMGRLREAGLLRTKLGTGGGALLARNAENITLLDAYRATEGETRLYTHDIQTDCLCPVARALRPLFRSLSSRLDSAIAEQLNRTTIADLAQTAWPRAPV